MVQLLVGLGNPGNEYAKTRHNAGAWFIEYLSLQMGKTLRFASKYHGKYLQTTIEGHTCRLLIPIVYMNHSGQAVQACMSYYNISPAEVLVVHDDIDLPAGTVKLKFDGGDGGHNGLKDIINHLHTKQFYRLRLGVGRPASSKEVVDYVLHSPSQADRLLIDEAITQAYQTLPLIVSGKIAQAMQSLHTRED